RPSSCSGSRLTAALTLPEATGPLENDQRGASADPRPPGTASEALTGGPRSAVSPGAEAAGADPAPRVPAVRPPRADVHGDRSSVLAAKSHEMLRPRKSARNRRGTYESPSTSTGAETSARCTAPTRATATPGISSAVCPARWTTKVPSAASTEPPKREARPTGTMKPWAVRTGLYSRGSSRPPLIRRMVDAPTGRAAHHTAKMEAAIAMKQAGPRRGVFTKRLLPGWEEWRRFPTHSPFPGRFPF